MFRSIVEAVSQRFARAKQPVAPIPEVGKGGVESNVVNANLDQIWTPENVVIPDRILSESEEAEIRLIAYSKWEAAGKPIGQQARFWLEAKEELLTGS